MKLISTALLAAGMIALAGCGGGAGSNAADANGVDDGLNLTTDELSNLEEAAPLDANAADAADAGAADANAADANAADAAAADTNATQ